MNKVQSIFLVAWVMIGCRPVEATSSLAVFESLADERILQEECPKARRIPKVTLVIRNGFEVMSIDPNACEPKQRTRLASSFALAGKINGGTAQPSGSAPVESPYGATIDRTNNPAATRSSYDQPRTAMIISMPSTGNSPNDVHEIQRIRTENEMIAAQYQKAGWNVQVVDLGQAVASGATTRDDYQAYIKDQIVAQSPDGVQGQMDVIVSGHAGISQKHDMHAFQPSAVRATSDSGVARDFESAEAARAWDPNADLSVESGNSISTARVFQTTLEATGRADSGDPNLLVVNGCHSGEALDSCRQLLGPSDGIVTSSSEKHASVGGLAMEEWLQYRTGDATQQAAYDRNGDDKVTLGEFQAAANPDIHRAAVAQYDEGRPGIIGFVQDDVGLFRGEGYESFHNQGVEVSSGDAVLDYVAEPAADPASEANWTAEDTAAEKAAVAEAAVSAPKTSTGGATGTEEHPSDLP